MVTKKKNKKSIKLFIKKNIQKYIFSKFTAFLQYLKIHPLLYLNPLIKKLNMYKWVNLINRIFCFRIILLKKKKKYFLLKINK
jgi:hypothetical protein